MIIQNIYISTASSVSEEEQDEYQEEEGEENGEDIEGNSENELNNNPMECRLIDILLLLNSYYLSPASEEMLEAFKSTVMQNDDELYNDFLEECANEPLILDCLFPNTVVIGPIKIEGEEPIHVFGLDHSDNYTDYPEREIDNEEINFDDNNN